MLLGVCVGRQQAGGDAGRRGLECCVGAAGCPAFLLGLQSSMAAREPGTQAPSSPVQAQQGPADPQLYADSPGSPSPAPLQVRYDQAGHERWKKSFSYESRPGPPWSYPQTGGAHSCSQFRCG